MRRGSAAGYTKMNKAEFQSEQVITRGVRWARPLGRRPGGMDVGGGESPLECTRRGNPLPGSTLVRGCVLSQKGGRRQLDRRGLGRSTCRYCLDMPKLCYGLRGEGITVCRFAKILFRNARSDQ